MTARILEDVRIVDLTQWVTGGFATLMLANQGAEVIKVERPGVGDDIRKSGPPFIEGESPYYWTVNYGKKSIEIDLKTDEGQQIVYDLVEEADVFVENFRPGKIGALELGYDELSEVNEELVYCSISAFGQTGPWADRAGYDLLIQGLSGVMSVTGEAGRPPVKTGIALTDIVTGMWAAFSIVTALHQRERRGVGEYIDLGMLDSMVPLMTKQAGKVFAGEEPARMGSRDPLHAPYQTFKAADGYVNIACGNQATWERLCEAIDRPELVDDPRFASNPDRVSNMADLEAELEATLRTRTVDEWVERLSAEQGVPAGPVHSVAEALDNEQVNHRAMVYELSHAAAGDQPVLDHPMRYRNADHGFDHHAPLLGQHTVEVLSSIGYDDDTIDALLREGIVSETGPENR